ncbi:MAG: hypothetical protein U9R32_10740, partial [Bacteroidota bacterium]|nr:hypothetical protein [Bacteroidota bacterium]
MQKKYILSIILATLILFLSIILINYKVDVFGINSLQKYYYNSAKYERYQNIGLVRNYNYDTIVTGTSLSENFKISLLNKLFNANAIKVPISGGTAKEQSLLLNVAVKNGVKKVFLDVHYNAYSGSSDRMHPSFQFPDYLYDKNMINDFKFYASFDTLTL